MLRRIAAVFFNDCDEPQTDAFHLSNSLPYVRIAISATDLSCSLLTVRDGVSMVYDFINLEEMPTPSGRRSLDTKHSKNHLHLRMSEMATIRRDRSPVKACWVSGCRTIKKLQSLRLDFVFSGILDRSEFGV